MKMIRLLFVKQIITVLTLLTNNDTAICQTISKLNFCRFLINIKYYYDKPVCTWNKVLS